MIELEGKWYPSKPEKISFWSSSERYQFESWWQTEIAPLFSSQFTVYTAENEQAWVKTQACFHDQKAVLINVQSIKEDSAEQLLKNIIAARYSQNGEAFFKELDKAKVFIEKHLLEKSK